MNNSEISNPDMPENLGASTPSVSANSNKWLKAGLLALVGATVAVVLVYAGYWYGTKSAKLKSQSLKPQLKTEKLTPTQAGIIIPTLSQDLTTNWKTYTNSELKISFKYPEDFLVNEERAYNQAPPAPTYLKTIAVYWKGEDPLIRRWLRIFNPAEIGRETKEKDENFLNLRIGESYTYESTIDFYETATRLENQIINGIEVATFEIPVVWEIEGPLRVLLLPKNNKIYRIGITYSNYSGREINYPKTFNQILSTFKILE